MGYLHALECSAKHFGKGNCLGRKVDSAKEIHQSSARGMGLLPEQRSLLLDTD
jgi:hypothetical protein